MPIIKSAKKRVRTAEKAAIRNSKTKRSLKTALKAFHRAVTGGVTKDVVESHAAAQSNIDTATKKGLMHPNKAARQKAQLAKSAKAAATATSTNTPAVKKPAAKKAAKPTVAKASKPATKKSAVKKPAAK